MDVNVSTWKDNAHKQNTTVVCILNIYLLKHSNTQVLASIAQLYTNGRKTSSGMSVYKH